MISIQSLFIASIWSFLLSLFVSYYLKKKNFLLDQIFSSQHKQLTAVHFTNKVTLCGGLIILICSLLFFGKELLILKILSILILIIGILSDINKLNSPKIRIICQLLIVLFLLLSYQNLLITDLRTNFLNNILDLKIASILFTIFCILILINGSNFLDGINTLVIGYYLLVLGIIVITSTQFDLYINYNIFYLIIFLFIVFLFNFFNQIYLGDSGSYLVSFLTAFFILDSVAKNDLVSPYFFCLLLWYPAFENLFSIIRRNISNKNNYLPDNNHLHQLIFKYLKQKNFIKQNYLLSSIVGLSINLFLLIKYSIGYIYYSNTILQVVLILFGVSCYLIFYFYLIKKIK